MSSSVFDLLDRIQKSPGMYLGYPSVQSLFMFLNGYGIARREVGIELTTEEEDFYEGFQPWLQRKIGIRSVASWAKLIMLSCQEERAGFEQFFELLSEFQQRGKASTQAPDEIPTPSKVPAPTLSETLATH